jgi:hypothetical protein
MLKLENFRREYHFLAVGKRGYVSTRGTSNPMPSCVHSSSKFHCHYISFKPRQIDVRTERIFSWIVSCTLTMAVPTEMDYEQQEQKLATNGIVLPNEERLEHAAQPDGSAREPILPHGMMNNHLTVQEVSQLPSPSPSPSPSPRSQSPSLVVTNTSNYTGTPFHAPHEDIGSRSFDAPYGGSVSGSKDGTAPSLATLTTLPPHESKLHDIPEEQIRKPRKLSSAKANGEVLKLSAAEIEDLMSAPESLPVASPAKVPSSHPSLSPALTPEKRNSEASLAHNEPHVEKSRKISAPEIVTPITDGLLERRARAETTSSSTLRRPLGSSRATSSPMTSTYAQSQHGKTATSPKRKPIASGSRPEPLDLGHMSSKAGTGKSSGVDLPSPIPQSIPLPPMSIPTYLQLELSSTRPSPLYIYRTAASEFPYESSKVKFERLLNFLLLPPQLEQVLYFGTLACLDAWLYTFTILPLRFFKAAWILVQWWGQVLAREARFILGFIYHGTGRMWHRSRGRRGSIDSVPISRSASRASRPSASTVPSYQSQSGRTLDVPTPNGHPPNFEHLKTEIERKTKSSWGRRHRRTKSQPSSLSSYHKADLLQGAVIVCSCMILMKLDASRMYHSIRGQAAIKLYVIFNVLEVCLITSSLTPMLTSSGLRQTARSTWTRHPRMSVFK